MRDINSERTVAREQEETDQSWWLKSAAFVVLVVMVIGYLGYKRSVALEYAIVGQPKNIAEVVAETRRMDKMRQQDWEDSERRRAAMAEPITEQDRADLVAIIKGAL